jgi:hypothetical protein
VAAGGHVGRVITGDSNQAAPLAMRPPQSGPSHSGDVRASGVPCQAGNVIPFILASASAVPRDMPPLSFSSKH